MQTTKWGPSGWNLFHNLAISYKPTLENRQRYKKFYESFKYVLPCKYCRESYTTFFDTISIDPYLVSSERLFYWTYLMHNKVNDKLRMQGFNSRPNPDYKKDIYPMYTNGCYNNCRYVDYVTFIGCIVFNYGSFGSTKDCPEKCIKDAYKVFFDFLQQTLPTYHKSSVKQIHLKNNCTLISWYFVEILTRDTKIDYKLFDKYLTYFADFRASCSRKTSCRVKL